MLCIKCHKSISDDFPFCPWCGHKQTAPVRSARRRGNGTGTAFKRGAYWYAQQTTYSIVKDENGVQRKERHRKTKGGFTTKKAALAYLSTMDWTKKAAPTLAELYDQWERLEMPKLSADKQTAYKKAYDRIKDIANRQIDTLTVNDLQSVVDENTTSYYTGRDVKTLLSHLYKRALPDGYVTQNLSQYIILPELEEKDAVPFTAKEVETLWTAYADGNAFVGYLLLMIYSGMMPGELFALYANNIDTDRCEIYGVGKKTKARKEAPIVYADVLRPVVDELIANARNDGRVVACGKWQFYDKYKIALDELNIPYKPPYACRHTTGTEAARQNLNASTIQKIMRHAKITTSQRYIHLGTEDAHKGINAIEPTGN